MNEGQYTWKGSTVEVRGWKQVRKSKAGIKMTVRGNKHCKSLGCGLAQVNPPFLHYPNWDQQAGPAHQDTCKCSAVIPQHNFLVEFCSIWGSSICSSVIADLGLILGTCPAQCDSDPLLCDAEHVHMFFQALLQAASFIKHLGQVQVWVTPIKSPEKAKPSSMHSHLSGFHKERTNFPMSQGWMFMTLWLSEYLGNADWWDIEQALLKKCCISQPFAKMINKPSFLIHRLTIGGKGAGLKDDKKLNCLAKVLADAAKGTGRAVSSSLINRPVHFDRKWTGV